MLRTPGSGSVYLAQLAGFNAATGKPVYGIGEGDCPPAPGGGISLTNRVVVPQNVAGYNAGTGKPIYGAGQGECDPATGSLKVGEIYQAVLSGFNPATGKPIYTTACRRCATSA